MFNKQFLSFQANFFMTHHYQEFAPSYEQLPRFHRPNTWGDFFMTGGENIMAGADSS